MTEKQWQERNYFIKKNEKNLNPILKNSYQEKIDKAPNKHFKDLYFECLKGSLDIKQWQLSPDLTIDDMALLACRDIGCDLNYCTTSMLDPYEKPFNNCNDQNKALFNCISREISRYESNPLAETIQDHLKEVLLLKKKYSKYNINNITESNNNINKHYINDVENINNKKIIMKENKLI